MAATVSIFYYKLAEADADFKGLNQKQLADKESY